MSAANRKDTLVSLQSKTRWNSAPAHRALNYIKAHPDEWDQANWRCRSGMCFAGVVCTLGGGRWINPEPTDKMSDALLFANHADEEYGLYLKHHIHADGPVVSASERASRLLGLTEHTDLGTDLFASTNSISSLERIIEILDAGQEARDKKAAEEARDVAEAATSQVG